MNRRRLQLALRCHPWFPALLLLAAAGQPASLRAQNAERDEWQRVPDVIAALAIDAGSQVADIGAGNGYFTRHLSGQVGPDGVVFAVEIGESELSRLRQLANIEDLDNIEVVRGEIDDPKLPGQTLDAVLVVDAYHEMTEHESMLAGMRRALRPGGRLVIIDLAPYDGSASRDRQTDSHRIGIDFVEREVRAAGFELLESDPGFTRTGRGTGQWMLVARRPAQSGSGS
jgi:predicted methyltransferase